MPQGADQQATIQAEAWVLLRPLLLRFEGLYLKPYICPAGVPTIGLGSLRYLDGRRVTMRDKPITSEHAWMLARHQVMTEYMPQTLTLCPGITTAHQLAAITDFSYNLGLGALRSSTLRKRINADRWEDVPHELAKWVRGGGRVLPGLVARRAAEAALLTL
jgi:lysozyme